MYFRSSRAAGIFACLLSLVFTSCQKEVTGPPPRYAIARFENLTGDPSLEWIARAASEVLSRCLVGALDGPVLDPAALTRVAGSLGFRPSAAPGISSEHDEALAAGATRIVSGYVERENGRIRIAAGEEDVATRKTTLRIQASDATPLKALMDLAHGFSTNTRPFLTSNQDALRLYATGVEESGEAAGQTLERALQADPNLGPAWLALIGYNVGRGDRPNALDLIAKASRQKLAPLDQTNIDLAAATLANDQKGRIEALRKILAMSPGDTVLLRSMAETETSSGQFEAAAADWNKLAAILPNDTNAWNQLGYTRAWSGDYTGAIGALKEYARLAPNDPNPLDSTGDVNYMYRKFGEAAASYLQANARQPQFQKGGDLYKAAWAKFKGADKAGGDTLFAQFRAVREKEGDAALPLLTADWLYRTGRQKDAVSELRKLSASGAARALRSAAFAQLAVWELLDGNRAAAAKDADAAGQPTSGGLLAIRFAALPSASRAEWEARAARMISAPSAASVRTIALAYALLLDGKNDDAREYFAQAVAAAPGTDFFIRAIYARLDEEKPKREILPDPTQVNEFAALLD